MIITDEKLLKIVSEPATLDEAKDIITKLDETLAWSAGQGRPGWGLSAIQIGIPKRVFIIRMQDQKLDCMNPSVTKQFDQIVFRGEGCLSYPDLYSSTLRYNEIVIKNDLYPTRAVLTGNIAVVFQHELDHLNGLVLPDISIK